MYLTNTTNIILKLFKTQIIILQLISWKAVHVTCLFSTLIGANSLITKTMTGSSTDILKLTKNAQGLLTY